MTATLYWLPLEHPCGCVLEWGMDERIAEAHLPAFLASAAPYPCPMHGSMSGHCMPLPAEGEVRLLLANGVHYRLIPRERQEAGKKDGKKNREVALRSVGGGDA